VRIIFAGLRIIVHGSGVGRKPEISRTSVLHNSQDIGTALRPKSGVRFEFIGDGVTTVVGRNLTALAASSTAGYVVAFDSNYV